MERNPNFCDISPELGELDTDAFDALFTEDESEALKLLADMAHATDASLAALARRLAGRLLLELAHSGPAKPRGVGKLKIGPADDSSHDLDIDASLEAIVSARAAKRPVSIRELQASQWTKPTTAICLLVDRSGSMSGERLVAASLAAAACTWRAPEEFSVLAFGSKIQTITDSQSTTRATKVVSDVLGLQGHGTTDLARALKAAKQQLDVCSARRRITILLSDAEVTAGDDPVPDALALDELAIVAPASAPEHARELSTATGAKLAEVDGPMGIVAAIGKLLS